MNKQFIDAVIAVGLFDEADLLQNEFVYEKALTAVTEICEAAKIVIRDRSARLGCSTSEAMTSMGNNLETQVEFGLAQQHYSRLVRRRNCADILS